MQALESRAAPDDTRAALDIDTVRGILMVLGIVLHAARIHTLPGTWLLADADRHLGFDVLVAFIHSFRVPGFFVLSGLLLTMGLQRRSLGELLQRQLLRLALPLLCAWLVLNSYQHWVLQAYGLAPQTEGWTLPPMYHLWFLRDLLVMDLVLLAVLALVCRPGRPGHSGASGLPDWARRVVMWPPGHTHWLTLNLVGAALGFAVLFVTRASGMAYVRVPLVDVQLFQLAHYMPLFLAGCLMQMRPDLLRSWLRTPLWLLPLAAALAYFGIINSRQVDHPPLVREVALACHLLGIWLATPAAVSALSRLLSSVNGPRPWIQRISRASYSIFLLHHPLVLSLGLLMLDWHMPALLKFGINSLATLLLCLFLHESVVRRSAVLTLLLNGRWKKRGAPAEANKAETETSRA